MKRTMMVALLAGVIASMGIQSAFATLPEERVKITCTTGATATLSTVVGTANRILGFSCSDSSAGTCGFYDNATTTPVLAATGTVIGEASVAAGATANVIFPFPVNVANGLVIFNKNSTSIGCAYYQ